MSGASTHWLTTLRTIVRRELPKIVVYLSYRVFFLIVFGLYFLRWIRPSRGPDFPNLIDKIPGEVFAGLLMAVLSPILVLFLNELIMRDKINYEPDTEKISIYRTRVAFVGLVLLSIGVCFLIISAALNVAEMAFTTLLVAPGIPLAIIGAMLIFRANKMKSGRWSPTKWNLFMGKHSQNHDQLSAEE